MLVMQWGGGLFLSAFLLHLILWRLHKPRSPIKALLAIFLMVLGAALGTQYVAGSQLGWLGLTSLSHAAAYLHVLLFFISMSFAYIVCYTILEWDSPTLTIVTLIARAGKRGLDEDELVKTVERLPFLESRIRELLGNGTLIESAGRYFLSPGYHLFYRSIIFYNRLLRADARSG